MAFPKHKWILGTLPIFLFLAEYVSRITTETKFNIVARIAYNAEM